VLAALFVFGAHAAADLVPGRTLILFVDAAIFAVCSGFAIRHFGLLNLPSGDVIPGSATVL
jgi:hypothetical protein